MQEAFVKTYESWYEGKGKRADKLEKELLSELVNYIGATRTMLEVGAGTAHFTRWFESLGIQCVGMDFSRLMLKEAKKLWHGELVRGDAHHLPFRDKTFDLVSFITSIEFINRPTDALKEARRVSTKGILCGALNRWSLPTFFRRIKAKLGNGSFYGDAQFYSILDVKHLLESALDDTNYRMKWSTTVCLVHVPIRKSPLPFGEFLGIAVKFTEPISHAGTINAQI